MHLIFVTDVLGEAFFLVQISGHVRELSPLLDVGSRLCQVDAHIINGF